MQTIHDKVEILRENDLEIKAEVPSGNAGIIVTIDVMELVNELYEQYLL